MSLEEITRSTAFRRGILGITAASLIGGLFLLGQCSKTYHTGGQKPSAGDGKKPVFEKPLKRYGYQQELFPLNPKTHLEEAEKVHYQVTNPKGASPGRDGKVKKKVNPTIENPTTKNPGTLFFQRRTSYILPRPTSENRPPNSRDAIILMDVSGSMTNMLSGNGKGRLSYGECIDKFEKLESKNATGQMGETQFKSYLRVGVPCHQALVILRNYLSEDKKKKIVQKEIDKVNDRYKDMVNVGSVAALAIARYYITEMKGYVSGGLFNQFTQFTEYTKNLEGLSRFYSVVPLGGTELDAYLLNHIITHPTRPDKNRPVDIYIISDLEIHNIKNIITQVRGLTQKGRVYVLTPTEEGQVTVMFGKEAYRAPLRDMNDVRNFYKMFKKGK